MVGLTTSMRRGRWRFFRHDAGQEAGPPPSVYLLLFVASQLLGLWSVAALDAKVMWPANAVLLAAVLQLSRYKALGVLVGCALINLVSNIIRGDAAVIAVTGLDAWHLPRGRTRLRSAERLPP